MACPWCQMGFTRYLLRCLFRQRKPASHKLCSFCERERARKIIKQCGSPEQWAYTVLFGEEQK